MSPKTKKIINLARFFSDCTPIVPYLAIFFSHNSISTPRIALLFSAWAVSVIIFEIPTGLLADRFNRQFILVLSKIIKLLCFVTWLIAPTFNGFLVGFILWGLASALDSGSLQAFIFDELKTQSREQEFIQVYGSASSWNFAGMIVATIGASMLVKTGFHVLLLCSILSMFVSALCIVLIRTKPPGHTTKTISSAPKIFTSGIRNIITHRLLLMFVMLGVIAGGIKGSLEEFNPLLLSAAGLPLTMIGIVIGFFESMKFLGSRLAMRLKEVEKKQYILLFCVGIMLCLSGILKTNLIVITISVLMIFDAILWIGNDAAIIGNAHEKYRATTLSIKNFFAEIIALLVFSSASIVTGFFPINALYILGGFVLVGTSVILAIATPKARLTSNKNP